MLQNVVPKPEWLYLLAAVQPIKQIARLNNLRIYTQQNHLQNDTSFCSRARIQFSYRDTSLIWPNPARLFYCQVGGLHRARRAIYENSPVRRSCTTAIFFIFSKLFQQRLKAVILLYYADSRLWNFAISVRPTMEVNRRRIYITTSKFKNHILLLQTAFRGLPAQRRDTRHRVVLSSQTLS